METKKFVYAFEEGNGKDKKLLGGKGANLCEMTQMGLPVPPGFVITTEACLSYLDEKKDGLQAELMKQIGDAMADLEKKTGKGFGKAGPSIRRSISTSLLTWMVGGLINFGT